jgi:uncharacterized membrane protein YedE/YeeE
MKALFSIGAGAIFGFLLSRARVTDYDTMLALFRLQDFFLLGVLGVAVVVAALGFELLRRAGNRSLAGRSLAYARKPLVPSVVLGSLVFGAGWALTGT